MKNTDTDNLNIAFFGTPEVAVYVLEELEKGGIMPSLIITAPDKPKGRKLVVTPPQAKVWAEKHNISIYQPEKLTTEAVEAIGEEGPWDIFIVAAYGLFLPKEILELPKYGVLNVHPSLLPKLRGPSPIQTAILKESETGVTIMQIDEEMDHGPIVAQEKIGTTEWPIKASELEELLSKKGGAMLIDIIPDFITGKIKATGQDHEQATYTKKIRKEDGEINLSDEAETNFRKFCAYSTWPRTYFFTQKNDKNIRVIITDATLEGNKFVIKKVIPEGGKEIDYNKLLA